MGKKVFAELDEITFNRIKNTKNTCGMVDEKKFFKKLNEGDSVIFSCRGKKIEAFLKKIKIYNSIGEYLKENKTINVLEINSRTPINFLSLMSGERDKNSKRVIIYEVDYHPYGEDDDNECDHDCDHDREKNDNITKFIEALINGGGSFRENNDDDEF